MQGAVQDFLGKHEQSQRESDPFAPIRRDPPAGAVHDDAAHDKQHRDRQQMCRAEQRIGACCLNPHSNMHRMPDFTEEVQEGRHCNDGIYESGHCHLNRR